MSQIIAQTLESQNENMSNQNETMFQTLKETARTLENQNETMSQTLKETVSQTLEIHSKEMHEMHETFSLQTKKVNDRIEEVLQNQKEYFEDHLNAHKQENTKHF